MFIALALIALVAIGDPPTYVPQAQQPQLVVYQDALNSESLFDYSIPLCSEVSFSKTVKECVVRR